MPLYTFTCANGHSHDALVGRDVASRPCPQCGLFADRESVYRVGFSGFAVPPSSERTYNAKPYMEASAEMAYRHARSDDAAPQPSLWKAAQAKAADLRRKGVTDSAQVKWRE